MTRLHPLRELTLARLREFVRHPEAVFWVYCFPILLAVGLGIAFRNRPVQEIPVDVEAHADAERTAAALSKDPALRPSIRSPAEAWDRLRLGKTAIIVRPGSGSGSTVVYDPSRPESTLARAQVEDALQRAAGRADTATIARVEVDEPGARYIDFLIPGLLGMNLLGSGIWGVGFVLVDMRVRKLMKRLVATPMKKTHFLLANIGGRLFFTLPEVVIMIVVGWLFFGMSIRGSILSIIVLSFIGAASFAGLGLLLASRVRTLEAVGGLMNLAMLPMWILSGTFFSSERFPAAVQPLVQALPLTHLNDALRAVILEGASLASQGVHIAVLVAWAVVTFLLALSWFRWS